MTHDPARAARRTISVLFAAAALWTSVEVIWRLTGEPAEPVNFAARVRELVVSSQPPGRNGWPLLEKAGKQAGEIERRLGETWREANPDAALEHPDVSLVHDQEAGSLDRGAIEWEMRLLDEVAAAGVLELLDDAAACPLMLREIRTGAPAIGVLLPNLGSYRRLARLRVAAMRLAALEGDLPGVVRAYEHTLALARACLAQSFLVDHLVGISIQGIAFGEVQFLLEELELDEATCRALLAATARQDAGGSIALAFEAERLMTLDTVHWCFTDNGHGDGCVDPAAMSDFYGMAMLGTVGFDGLAFTVLAGRAETVRKLETFFSGLIDLARMRPAERAQAAFDPDAFVGSLPYRHMFLRVMLPALSKAMTSGDRLAILRDAIPIQIAIEAHRAVHGEDPATLEDLVPEFLPTLPVDPSSGAAYVYRRLDTPQWGWTYLLYAPGADGIDDTAGEDLGVLDNVMTFSDSPMDDGYDVAVTGP